MCTDSPVPKCQSDLQMGALVENPILYYICIRTPEGLYPRLYRCPNGLMFDSINAQCVESLPLTTTAPKTQFKCEKSGLFPDPEDCHSYYSCSNDLRASHRTCRVGYFLDKLMCTWILLKWFCLVYYIEDKQCFLKALGMRNGTFRILLTNNPLPQKFQY